MNQNQRVDFVKQQIEKLHDLLLQWEQEQLTARDPNERERSKSEIIRIKQLLEEYKRELQGGKTVDESIQAPLIAPEIRKNNRKWIVGILIALLLGGSIFFILNRPETPDFNKYLSFLNQGDSLVKVNKFPEAKVAYKKAISYNPGDSAATQKISYLKKADELIAQNKFNEAKKVFEIVIKIPASMGLSPQALAMLNNNGAEASNTVPLTFSMEWKDGILYITVSGGSPNTANNESPYDVKGILCKNCVQWTSDGKNYIGSISHEKVNTASIQIADSKGKTLSETVPDYKIDAVQPKTHTDSPIPNSNNESNNEKEQRFKALTDSGDQFFVNNKFSLAQQDYEAAFAINQSDILTQKIAECKKKVAEELLYAARHIPLISVPAGTFSMGTSSGNLQDGPVHSVKLLPFAIGKSEVTVAQYKAYCKYTNKNMPPAPPWGWDDDDPITNVTWEEAKIYCEWTGGRLPTEAEWEYAARDAGNSDKMFSGSNDVEQVAIYKNNSGGKPAHVKTKAANGLGIFDMTGNVSEWCADWYGKNYYASSDAVDPKGPSLGTEKVIRGGSFNSVIDRQAGNQLRTTYRNSWKPTARADYIGFRVVWEN